MPGTGTVVQIDFDDPHHWSHDRGSDCVSVRMDDGRFYRYIHANWLELRSPTIRETYAHKIRRALKTKLPSPNG